MELNKQKPKKNLSVRFHIEENRQETSPSPKSPTSLDEKNTISSSLNQRVHESLISKRKRDGFKSLESREKRLRTEKKDKEQKKDLENIKKKKRKKEKKANKPKPEKTEREKELENEKKKQRKIFYLFQGIWKNPYSWALMNEESTADQLDPSFPSPKFPIFIDGEEEILLNLNLIQKRVENQFYKTITEFYSEMIGLLRKSKELNHHHPVFDISQKLLIFFQKHCKQILGEQVFDEVLRECGEEFSIEKVNSQNSINNEGKESTGVSLLNKVFGERLKTRLKSGPDPTNKKYKKKVELLDQNSQLSTTTTTTSTTTTSSSFNSSTSSNDSDDSFTSSDSVSSTSNESIFDKMEDSEEQENENEIRSEQGKEFSLQDLYESLDCPTEEQHIEFIPGLKNTSLYPYQIRSIYACWKREVYEEDSLDPSLSPSISGGMLCEEMGRGKTIICLSLILLTRGQPSTLPPTIPPSFHNDFISLPPSPSLFESFSQSSSGDELEESDDIDRKEDSKMKKIPSLLDLCCYYIRKIGMDFREIPDELRERIEKVREAPHYFLHSRIPISDRMRQFISSQDTTIEHQNNQTKIYISFSNLIIVPANIIHQWLDEINNRVENGYLRVYHSQKDLPPPQELIYYDIVLLTHTDLTREASKKELIGQMSTLSQIRWRRLIIDEGHIVAQMSKRALFAKTLPCESRWVVSGTPSPGSCLSIQLGRLYGLLNFLNFDFYSDSKNWNRLIKSKLLRGEVEGYERLKALLTKVMVRNSSESLQNDIKLPPLIINVQRIEFSEEEKRKYNSLVGLVKTNLICSEFTGIDCILHPLNRTHALRAIENISLSCFYYLGLDSLETFSCFDTIQKYIQSKTLRSDHLSQSIQSHEKKK